MNFIKRFFGNIAVKNLIIMFLFGILLIVGLLYWLDSYTHHNQAIKVPDLKGLQVDEAEMFLKKNKLRYQVVDSVYSKLVAPGAIVEQIPAGNAKVKENRIVFLTVNAKTAQTVVLPDMFEISSRQAEATLRSLGFVIDSLQYIPYEYKGLVVNVLYNNRVIDAGSRLPYGAHLWLQIGDGFETIEDSTELEMDKEWFE